MKPVNFLWEILGYILYIHRGFGGGKKTSEGRKKKSYKEAYKTELISGRWSASIAHLTTKEYRDMTK